MTAQTMTNPVLLPAELAPQLAAKILRLLDEVPLTTAPKLVPEARDDVHRCVVCHRGGKLGGHHGADGRIQWIHRGCPPAAAPPWSPPRPPTVAARTGLSCSPAPQTKGQHVRSHPPWVPAGHIVASYPPSSLEAPMHRSTLLGCDVVAVEQTDEPTLLIELTASTSPPAATRQPATLQL